MKGDRVTPIVDDSEMLRAYAETIRLKEAEIERLRAERDHWEYECKIAYKAFDESNVKKFYEETHQADIEEHNRMMHEIAVLKSLLTRAADALEDLKGPGWKRELIAELRKAAE